MKDRKYLREQLRHQEWIQERLARRSGANREKRPDAADAVPGKPQVRPKKPPAGRASGVDATHTQGMTCNCYAA